MWDEDEGYDTDDPKHRTFADRMYDAADLIRKREREDPSFACDGSSECKAVKHIHGCFREMAA